MEAAIFVRSGREKSILQKHPWIFSGAVERVIGSPEPGETVEVYSAGKEWLGRAAFSPQSNIRARLWTWNKGEEVGREFFRRQLEAAFARRKAFVSTEETSALRLVHAESDGLPGIIVDRYEDVLVAQFLTAGAEFWRETVVDLLAELTGCDQIYERSDVDVRSLEGMKERAAPLKGVPPERICIQENGLRFWVDIQKGHKTGFYLDQRNNRQIVRSMVKNRQVLNCFSYTGGFAVYALAGGASHVLSVDSSAEALELGRQNIQLNGFEDKQAEWLEGDVFHVLRSFRDQNRRFDAIILDPPKFAPTIAQAEKAARGYKDINLLALKMLEPGGLLFTFSCSGGISADLFQKIVAGAALDAGVEASIIGHMFQGPDHPVALNFPEGAYLKGLVCQVGEKK